MEDLGLILRVEFLSLLLSELPLTILNSLTPEELYRFMILICVKIEIFDSGEYDCPIFLQRLVHPLLEVLWVFQEFRHYEIAGLSDLELT